MPSLPVLVGIGALAGFLAGVIGAGGGVATLLLLVGAGFDPHMAVGTSLLFSVGMGGGGSLIHYRQGTADPMVALALGIPAAGTAVVGAHLNGALPNWILTFGLAALASATAVAVLLHPSPQGMKPEAAQSEPATPPASRLTIHRRRRAPGGIFTYDIRLPVAVPGGAVIGLAQGLLGVGGGFLFVPVMVRAMKMPEHVAVGSSLFAIMIGGLSGGIAHAIRNNVDFSALATLLPCGLLGVWAGARASRRLSGAAIRRAFAIALILTAVFVSLKAVT